MALISTLARKADAFVSSHSVMLLLLLLLLSHLLTSVCDGRPASSRHHGHHVDNPASSQDANGDEPNVFAVFERRDPISGNYPRISFFLVPEKGAKYCH